MLLFAVIVAGTIITITVAVVAAAFVVVLQDHGPQLHPPHLVVFLYLKNP